MSTIAIRPIEGRRLPLPDGATDLAGVPLPAGTDMPAEGAIVPRDVWTIRCIGRGDAEEVPPTPAPSNRGRPQAASTGDAA